MTSRFNAEQFANMKSNVAGVIFVYESKDGKESAIHFFGADFEATAKTQDELLRVMRNVVSLHWMIKIKETELREKNDGIRCKLRATTPTEIIINGANGETIKKYDTANSDFAKFGFFPTKKDLERSARDQKKYIHSATIALLEALNFRVDFPKAEKEEKVQKKALAESKPEIKTNAKADTKTSPATTTAEISATETTTTTKKAA